MIKLLNIPPKGISAEGQWYFPISTRPVLGAVARWDCPATLAFLLFAATYTYAPGAGAAFERTGLSFLSPEGQLGKVWGQGNKAAGNTYTQYFGTSPIYYNSSALDEIIPMSPILIPPGGAVVVVIQNDQVTDQCGQLFLSGVAVQLK